MATVSSASSVRSPLPSVDKQEDADEQLTYVAVRDDEDETKQNNDDDERDERRGSRPPPLKLKIKPRASVSDANAEHGNDDDDDDDDDERSQRSPARLATSLFGRERMARAARAWREGARRAGFLLGDEEDEEKEEELEESSPLEPQDELVVVIAGRNKARSSSEDAAPAAQRADPRIPRLALTRLAPKTRVHKLSHVWMCLDRIEYITIREAFIPDEDEGTVHYVLDVYHYQEQHSIPTHHHHPMRATPPPRHREPDYRIQQRFSSFTRLRKHVLDASRWKHAAPCAYCDKMSAFASASSPLALGWRAKLFTTVDTRKVLLSQFISQLVVLARERRDACPHLTALATAPHLTNRHVHRTLPGIVKRFLTVQTGENFMR